MIATLLFVFKLAFIKFMAFPIAAKILLGTALYLLSVRYIGLRLIARPSWEVWQNKKPSIKSFLLFPYSTLTDDLGNPYSPCLIREFTRDAAAGYESYTAVIAGSWPIKIAWNLVMMIIALIIGVLFIFYQVIKMTIK
jgi:hypothetical protein